LTLPRPTDLQVGTTLTQLHHIAMVDSDTYRLLADLIGLYVWLLDEAIASEEGRGFGHGASEVHVFGNGGGGDLEGRLYDSLLKEQRRVKRQWKASLRHTGHRWHDDASNIARLAEPWGRMEQG
jgi:hypothetical protein